MKLVIVTPFWNSERFITKCIESIQNQFYTNFVVYLIDDMSTDNSYNIAKSKIEGDDRFILTKNTVKKYKAKNFIDTIKGNPNIEWDDVIVELDGDDELSDNLVLGLLNKIYTDDNVWICGSKWADKSGRSMKYGRANADKARSTTWNFSHLRTYRAFLFRMIKDEHLTYKGEFLKAAVDLGIGIPMLEMAGNEHYYYLDQITYTYNWHDHQSYSNNSSFGDSKLQGETAKYIYSLPVYEKIKLVKGDYILESKPELEFKKSSADVLNDTLRSINDTPINPKNNSTVNYDLINQILNQKNVYIPRDAKQVSEQHKPDDRKKLIEIKKGSMADMARTMRIQRPNGRDLSPNVFGGKKKK